MTAMRRSGQDELRWPQLVAGTLGTVWRCRLEVALGGLIMVAFVLFAGLIGELAAGMLVAVLVGLALAVPRLRGRLLHGLRAARVRRGGGGGREGGGGARGRARGGRAGPGPGR